MVAPQYGVRCWQGKGRSDGNVVGEATSCGSRLGLRWARAPRLTALGYAHFKERQTVFKLIQPPAATGPEGPLV